MALRNNKSSILFIFVCRETPVQRKLRTRSSAETTKTPHSMSMEMGDHFQSPAPVSKGVGDDDPGMFESPSFPLISQTNKQRYILHFSCMGVSLNDGCCASTDPSS